MVGGVTSAKLKLAMAEKHLRAIKKCVAAYSASRPYKIVKMAKGKKKLNIPKPPPRAICILAGEMVYQMRSALDHLAFSLVKQNPNVVTIDPQWFENCEFPLKTKIPKNCTPPLAQTHFSKKLPGISEQAFAFIESVQPYHRKRAVSNCLRFLAGLSNIDKHRYLNVIGPRVEKLESMHFASGLHSSSSQALDRGAEIYTAPFWNQAERPMNVRRRFHAIVNFNERAVLGDAVTLPAEDLLEKILGQINTIIVPELEKFIKKTRP